MATHDYLKDLKRISKELARSKRISLHEAQKSVAVSIGFPHWQALATKVKFGHELSASDVAKAEVIQQLERTTYPDEGLIDGHTYMLDVVLDDVIMNGRGWRIFVSEAPSRPPQVMVVDKRFKNNPINDPEFVAKALSIANWKAERVRSSIARDWPRGSTKPDSDGTAVHPIQGIRSGRWYCLHCDRESTGGEMAKNLWHCPSCSASPLDIFDEPFWLEVAQERPTTTRP